jgi:signal transduction histidine kinase
MPERDLAAEIHELRQMVVRLSRMVEISVTLNSTLEIGPLLQFIIRSAADLLDCEAASILLVDEKTHDLYFAASTGSDPAELARIPVPLEGSIAGTIFREDRPLIINEVARDPRHFTGVGNSIRYEVRSLIGVPMRIRDKVTGVLEAVNARRGVFEESDVINLSNIASQAAIAIHNARLIDALQKAYDELGKLEKLKSDFIAIASHELRTPLGLIMGYAALLKDEAGAASAEHAEVVLNSAMRMRGLIEDMTNLNLLQIGAAEMSFDLSPLQPVVQAAYDEVAELIRAKEQIFELNLPEEPLTARTDAPKLILAVTNLLNNAMRFTPPGGRIWVELFRRNQEIWLRVGDNGKGVQAKDLERIFQRFSQTEDHMTRHHGGMGIGLAIVRAIVEAHEGRIWADSDGPEQGSIFTIALPRADVS